FEHRAAAVRSTTWCGAEQVAVGVGDQAAVRTNSVAGVEIAEVDQGVESVGAIVVDEFEYRAINVRSIPLCGTEQVAVGVGDQAAVRKHSVRVHSVDAVKIDQGAESVGAVIVDEFEHRAEVKRSTDTA